MEIENQEKSALCGWNLKSKIIKSKINKIIKSKITSWID